MLITFLLIVNYSFSQYNPVDILKSVQEKFNSIKDLSVDIIQMVNSQNPAKGKLFFKHPENYRLEITNQVIINDGKTFWNYNKRQNKVIIDNFTENNDNLFSINYLLNELPLKSNISLELDGNFKKLILKPKDNSIPYNLIEIWVQSDKLVHKVNAFDNTGTSYTIIFKNYKINQNLKSDLFSFKISEGIKVIDLR